MIFGWSTFCHANPGGRAAQGVGLPPLACWDCGFELHRGQGCLSVVIAVCCQGGVFATGRSLILRSASECVTCLSVISKFQRGRLDPLRLLSHI